MIQDTSNVTTTTTQFVTQSAQEPPFIVFLFSTGVVYINYLVQKGYMFIIHEELFSAYKIKTSMQNTVSQKSSKKCTLKKLFSLYFIS